MFIKKTRQKRADGPAYWSGGIASTDGRRFVPEPYTGRLPNGRRTWINGGMIAFKVDDETIHVEQLSLAELLNELGITDGEPSDWIQNPRVEEWVKSCG